jgi:hypothetical protein
LVPSTVALESPAFPAPQTMPAAISAVAGGDADIAEPSMSPPAIATAAKRLRAVTAALRPLAAMTGSGSRRAIAWVTASRNRMLAVGGGTVGVLALVIAIAAIGGDDDPTTTIASTSDNAASTTLTSASIEPAVVGAKEANPGKSDTPSPNENAKDEPSEAGTGATGAAATAEEAEPIAVDERAAPIAKAPARPQGGQAKGIVFAPRHSPKKTFRKAKQMCDDMNVGGAQGWRMPTLAELHVLAVAKAIDRGVYWSGTEADSFGSRALIWSEKKTAAAPITKAWGGARALCVKDEGAAP